MTFPLLLTMLRGHLAALRSSAWPRPHGPATGPALYLDEADTIALIAELTRLEADLAALRSGGKAPGALLAHAGGPNPGSSGPPGAPES